MIDKEAIIIRDSKVQGFGAYLQYSWFVYYGIKNKLENGELPKKSKLEQIAEKTRERILGFQIVYEFFLPNYEINPLAEEQKLWGRLAPDLKNFYNGFINYLKTYSPDDEKDREENKLQFECYLNIWWGLLQEWNTLSNKFKPKLEQAYSFLKE
jgi:hypothetical protein